jgi:APA family basic amino acid/polyamine antiporter
MRSARQLVRGLGQLEATTLVVGGIIGTTIFLVTSEVAATVGSPALVLATWLVAGLLAGAAALCFAELSAAIPETGGTYVFLKRAYGSDLVCFGFAWMMCFTYGPGATAVVAIMAATFLLPVLQALGLVEAGNVAVTAILIIAFLTALNASGVRRGGLAQNVITFVKVSLILAVIVMPFVFAGPQFERLMSPAPQTVGPLADLQNVGTAMILCLFSFSGAYFVTHVAEEVREPERSIPKAIVSGFLIVLALYLSINVAYLVTLPFDEVVHSERIAADMMGKVLGERGALLTAFVIFCSAVGALNTQLLSYPRIPFALARDGFLFRRIAEVSRHSRVPANAIILLGGLASLFALTGSYSEILSFVAFVSHFFICLAVLAVVMLRVKEPDLPRPYRVWGYPLTPIAFLLVSAIYLVNLLVTRPLGVSVGIVMVLAGLPFYFYWQRMTAAREQVL